MKRTYIIIYNAKSNFYAGDTLDGAMGVIADLIKDGYDPAEIKLYAGEELRFEVQKVIVTLS